MNGACFFLTHESFTRLLQGSEEVFHETLHLGFCSQQATPLRDFFLLHAFTQHCCLLVTSSGKPLWAQAHLGTRIQTCTPCSWQPSQVHGLGTMSVHVTHVSPMPSSFPQAMVAAVASSSTNSYCSLPLAFLCPHIPATSPATFASRPVTHISLASNSTQI